MKKLLTLLVGFLLFSFSSAYAVPFHWDLSTTGFTATGATVSGSDVNFPIDMTASGIATVRQSLTGGADDNKLDNGDTFSELGFVTVISANTLLGEKSITFDGGASNAYIKFSGLSGYIFGHSSSTDTIGSDGGTGILDDEYSYAFTPGEGSIDFYLDHDVTDFDPTTTTNGTALKIASAALITGGGTSPFIIPGSIFPEGDLGLTIGFTWVRDDTWYLSDPDIDFNDWMTLYGIPSIFGATFNFGATYNPLITGPATWDNTTKEYVVKVVNEGSLIINPVPEPTTMLLLGFGLLGLAGIGRKRS